MKHEKIYKKVRKLIDERELDEENLEEAHEELIDLTERDETCGWACGLLAEIYFWMGETAEAAADKIFYYEEGIKWGEQGVVAENDSLEANFWLAVNYGSFGQEQGILKSLALVPTVKSHAEKSLEIDRGYFYGGPLRVLGRLYDKAPGFPLSIGDGKKAEKFLLEALESGPKFYLNHLFLAEFYLAARKKEKAREHLEWIIEAAPNKNHEREDEIYKNQAKKLLKNL